jgi:hypothetical protein
MVAYLFRERHPGQAGQTIALREPAMVKRGYDGYEIRMFCSFENSIRFTLASWLRFLLIKPSKIPLIAARARQASEAGYRFEKNCKVTKGGLSDDRSSKPRKY